MFLSPDWTLYVIQYPPLQPHLLRSSYIQIIIPFSHRILWSWTFTELGENLSIACMTIEQTAHMPEDAFSIIFRQTWRIRNFKTFETQNIIVRMYCLSVIVLGLSSHIFGIAALVPLSPTPLLTSLVPFTRTRLQKQQPANDKLILLETKTKYLYFIRRLVRVA